MMLYLTVFLVQIVPKRAKVMDGLGAGADCSGVCWECCFDVSREL